MANPRTKYQQKIINKAMKMLAEEKEISNQDAYGLIRKKAMNNRQTVYSIAEITLHSRG